MRKKRVIDTQSIETPEEIGSANEAFKALVTPDSVPEQVQTPEPPETPPPEGSLVDDYLKKKVYMEMYGTENPTNYERTLEALRNRL